MPLTPQDRRFLQRIDRPKPYIILIAAAVLCFLLLNPTKAIQMASSAGLAMCGEPVRLYMRTDSGRTRSFPSRGSGCFI